MKQDTKKANKQRYVSEAGKATSEETREKIGRDNAPEKDTKKKRKEKNDDGEEDVSVARKR